MRPMEPIGSAAELKRLCEEIMAWWAEHEFDVCPCGDEGDYDSVFHFEPPFVESAKAFLERTDRVSQDQAADLIDRQEIDALRLKVGDAELCLQAISEARAAIRKDTGRNLSFLDDDLRNWAAHWEREIVALKKERGELRQRVAQAQKAAKTTIEDCKRQGVSIGRYLANYAYGMVERENAALLEALKSARQLIGAIKPPVMQDEETALLSRIDAFIAETKKREGGLQDDYEQVLEFDKLGPL